MLSYGKCPAASSDSPAFSPYRTFPALSPRSPLGISGASTVPQNSPSKFSGAFAVGNPALSPFSGAFTILSTRCCTLLIAANLVRPGSMCVKGDRMTQSYIHIYMSHNMCVCVLHVCVYIYIYIYIYMYVYNIHISTYLYIYIYTYVYFRDATKTLK